MKSARSLPPARKALVAALAGLAPLLLAGCGQKGPLVLPPASAASAPAGGAAR